MSTFFNNTCMCSSPICASQGCQALKQQVFPTTSAVFTIPVTTTPTTGWICARCQKSNAPFVNQCTCTATQNIPQFSTASLSE